jgi:signal recognition particle 43 kDa protein
MTWEPTANLSEDLVRDFEEAFWQACKIGDMQFLKETLKWGGETLANLLNADGRGPLHLTAALNHQNAVRALIEAGTLSLS